MSGLSVVELTAPPDDFLPDEPEGAAFHKAFLASGIDGFKCLYLEILRNGVRIAVVPCFSSTFSLTSLMPDGLLKKTFAWIKFDYVCVGHPATDLGAIDGEISADVLELVNATLSSKASIIAYKGFPENLPLRGFSKMRGLPISVLTISGDYYSMLDARRRNDFKHKRERAQALRVEEYSPLPDGLVPEVFRLYLNTYNHAATRFEQLTPDYFRNTAPISKFLLFFEADRPIGFGQIIGKNSKACFTYLGMDYQRNREYGLYYVICLKVVETCIKYGYRQLDLGVTSYHFKHLLGGRTLETSLYVRHKNPLANWLLGKCRFLLEPEPDELA